MAWQDAASPIDAGPRGAPEPYVVVPPARVPEIGRAPPGNNGIAPAGATLSYEPSSNAGLPPEADVLYSRVRKAEGTAQGDGFVIYGGKAFTPGKDHPGAAARVPGPQGPTSAAGPGQWEEKTWNGLKPDFEKRFGREPDFSDDGDHKRMTWLNAAKIYPGGEDAMRRDISAGKLDTSKLASQWSGFGGWRSAPVVGSGNWNVSPKAIEFEQGRKNTQVSWLGPSIFRDELTEGKDDDPAGRAKHRSLAKSLALGEDIDDLPSIEVKHLGNGKYQVIDYDGRHRMAVAQKEGVDIVPTAIHGVDPSNPIKQLVGMTGKERAFDFQPVPVVKPTPGGMTGMTDGLSEVGRLLGKAAVQTAELPVGAVMGAARPVVGLGQLAAHGAEAAGIPGGAGAAGLADRAAEGLEAGIGKLTPDAQGMAAVGDVAATAAVPLSRIAQVPRLIRPLAAAAAGAAGGAAQPVVGAGPQGYWPQEAQNAAVGAATGGALQFGAEMGKIGANAYRHFVTPGTLTSAAMRRFGVDADKITPQLLSRLRRQAGDVMERVETTHSVKMDTPLLRDLSDVRTKAIDSLGPTEAQPVLRAIDNILERFARAKAVTIPASSAATLWRKGSALDNMTESKNFDIARLAQQAQTAVRNALERQIPPADAAAYKAARHEWRDLKIVEKSLRPGDSELTPGRFVTQVGRRYPDFAYNLNPPEMLRVGQAAGQTWRPSQNGGRGLFDIVAAAAAEHAAPGAGLVTGIATRLLRESASRTRYAGQNALNVLRGPTPPPRANMLPYLAASPVPLTMPSQPAMAR